MRDLTRCVHHPAIAAEGYASLAVATHRASTIVYPDAASFNARRHRGFDGYTYGLHGTPTTRTLEAQITALHGGARTVLVPSGQAAAAMVFLALLLPGDRVLIPDNAYGPVRSLCRDWLAPRGVVFEAYDPMIGAGLAGLMDARTKLVWIESPGSATMEVGDVPALIRAAKAGGALVGCANPWCSPLLFKPLAHGADIAVAALTKYVGGHSDLLLGSITVADVALRDRIKVTMRELGIGVSPDEVALALRGIETMGVRLAHIGRVSEDFARRLRGHAAVARVLHPAVPDCPGHDNWQRDIGRSSGVFTLVLRPGVEAGLDAALGGLAVFAIGASWGGTRSLLATQEVGGERSAVPWTERGTLLRVSIGLEDEADLWTDLSGLLDRLAA